MSNICLAPCYGCSPYEPPILALPVAWSASNPYFTLADLPNQGPYVDLIPLRGRIILAGHRRLIIGNIHNVVSTHETHLILAVYGAASERMREKIEVHLRVPYAALTRSARVLAMIHRGFYGTFKDDQLPHSPGTHIKNPTLNVTRKLNHPSRSKKQQNTTPQTIS